MRRYLCGAAICRLTLTPKMTVSDRLSAGYYGPTFRRGRRLYTALEAVEGRHGLSFSEAQLEAAAEGRHGRILSIPEPDEVTDHGTV